MARKPEPLFDMILRHALYFEGVKRGAGDKSRTVAREADRAVRTVLARVRVKTLGQLTKKQFAAILAEVRAEMKAVAVAQTKVTVAGAKQLVAAEIPMFQRIYRRETAERVAAPTNTALWAKVRNTIIPANGLTVNQHLNTFVAASVKQVADALTQGYANNAEVSAVVETIRGTKAAGYRNGRLARIASWADSMTQTLFAHTNSVAKHQVAKSYFDSYQWVSVLDDATTEVCEERHGEIYKYGEGPQPPAHYGCRSETVPVNGDPAPDISLADWLDTQPAQFLTDIFKTDDRSLDNVKVIQLDRFKDKIDIILI